MTLLLTLACQQYGFVSKGDVSLVPLPGGDTATEGACVPTSEQGGAVLEPTCSAVAFEGYELALLWHHSGLVTESPIVLPRGSASVVIAAQHESGEVSRSVFIDGINATSELFGDIEADEGPFGNLCGHNASGTALLGLNELRAVRDADDPSQFDWAVTMAAFGPSTTVTRSVADLTTFLPGCWWYDVDVDGDADLINQYALYDPESLAVRVLYDRPDWEQSAAAWYEPGHGGIDVVADVNGTCRAEMPIELGVIDTVSGEFIVRWRDAEGNDDLIHTFNGGAVRQGDTVLWWGTETSENYSAFPRHVVLAEANGLIRWRREEARISVPAIGDVDGDGAPDMVCRNPGNDEISVWRMDRLGRLLDARDIGIDGASWKVEAVRDWDGNGCSDLLLSRGGSGKLVVLYMHFEGGIPKILKSRLIGNTGGARVIDVTRR